MTQFKDKSAKGGEGAQRRPVHLPGPQAADILLYQADQVPVGEDQRQHLELTRDLAERFNHRFGETFPLPEPYILGDREDLRPAGPDGQDEQVGILAAGSSTSSTTRQSAKKIRSAVTDSETEIRFDPEDKPGVTNLLTSTRR